MLLIRKIHNLLKNTKVYRSFIYILIIIMIFSLIFYFSEIEKNPKINNIGDIFWWAFVTSTTVGYGDIYPVTAIGRIVSIMLMIIGVGIFGFITGSFASIFLEKNLKKGMGLLDVKFKDHIIIVGWNRKTKLIIEELINEDKNIKIVIIDNIDENPYSKKNISYIKGDPWQDEVLIRANVKEANKAIVLADKSLEDANLIDSKSVLICLAIHNLNKYIYLIAETISYNNKIHFQRANVNDILVSSEIESKVLVRSILYKGVNKAINELITNSYGCELYETSIPKEYIDKEYIDISSDLIMKGITLLGFFRDEKTYLNPDKNMRSRKDDKLIYIAPSKLL